jgi:hypothetical protein
LLVQELQLPRINCFYKSNFTLTLIHIFMENNQPKFDLKSALELRSDYQGPRRPPSAKDVQLHCENAVNQAYHNLAGSFVFVTVSISPSQNLSFDEEWDVFSQTLPRIINTFSRNYLLAGAVVGVEMYEKRKNKSCPRAGRPHAHMLLFPTF